MIKKEDEMTLDDMKSIIKTLIRSTSSAHNKLRELEDKIIESEKQSRIRINELQRSIRSNKGT